MLSCHGRRTNDQLVHGSLLGLLRSQFSKPRSTSRFWYARTTEEQAHSSGREGRLFTTRKIACRPDIRPRLPSSVFTRSATGCDIDRDHHIHLATVIHAFAQVQSVVVRPNYQSESSPLCLTKTYWHMYVHSSDHLLLRCQTNGTLVGGKKLVQTQNLVFHSVI